MKKIFQYTCLSVFAWLSLMSCQKNAVTGSAVDVNQYKGLTTYQYLQQRAGFDTLVKVIDAAGMKDAINANNTTFFAPGNYSINNYLSKYTLYLQATVNQYAKFTIDSLLAYVSVNKQGLKDSLKMYLFGRLITYDNLTEIGAKFPSNLANDSSIVSYESTKDVNLGYNPNLSSPVKVVYFAHLFSGQTYDVNSDNPSSDMPSNIGTRVISSRSGITTSNGVVHELNSTHTLFFRK